MGVLLIAEIVRCRSWYPGRFRNLVISDSLGDWRLPHSGVAKNIVPMV